MSTKAKKKKANRKRKALSEEEQWRKKMYDALGTAEDVSLSFDWDEKKGTPREIKNELEKKLEEVRDHFQEAQVLAEEGIALFEKLKGKKKSKKAKIGPEACFICKETEPEHHESAPHGKCPDCERCICTACWWSYHVVEGDTACCVFCAEDERPENCECPAVEACECLQNAKNGERGHEPTWSEVLQLSDMRPY